MRQENLASHIRLLEEYQYALPKIRERKTKSLRNDSRPSWFIHWQRTNDNYKKLLASKHENALQKNERRTTSTSRSKKPRSILARGARQTRGNNSDPKTA
jgi:hemolysin-activating ACP:hemolysin acyltransferase